MICHLDNFVLQSADASFYIYLFIYLPIYSYLFTITFLKCIFIQ